MLVIYIDRQTNRLGYTINLLFKEILGVDFMVTTSKETFIAEKGEKFSYSVNSIYDEIHITSTNLLFETSVNNFEVDCFEKDGVPCLFRTYGKNDSLNFDVLSAIFYMVSRYEEYLPFMPDKHSRYSAKESIAYRKGFIEKPVVNIWANMLKNVILEKYPEMNFAKKTFSFTNTIDVDMAYYYKGKGLYRSLGGCFRDLLRRDFHSIGERVKVLLFGKQDPYDCFEFIKEIHTQYKLKTILFYLFAFRTDFDKNVSPYNNKFQLLVKDLADYTNVGIHPSYYVYEQEEKLQEQLSLLKNLIHLDINFSRFHYLRYRLPVSYRNLIDNRISDDFSMGYPNCVGFRAGIASSFNFYDLERDEETNLRLHPFAFMDVALKNGLHLNKTQSFEKIKALADEVKRVDGELISIWHNESLSDYKEWQGWRNIYKNQIEYISKINNTSKDI
ncbi:MAG: polysaccharide deacetylase family protein [Bacteroidales bacterium]|nr:polysaccharide deacetylase family protein [Candidatus Scybalousia scybalohippi]